MAVPARRFQVGATVVVALSLAPTIMVGQQRPQTRCPASQAAQAHTVFDQVKTWTDLRGWFRIFSACVDGSLAEEVDDYITKTLADKWAEVSTLERLLRNDAPFKGFVLKHLGGTANDDDIRKVVDNVTRRCPAPSRGLCADLVLVDRWTRTVERASTSSPSAQPNGDNRDLPLTQVAAAGSLVGFPGADAAPAPGGNFVVKYRGKDGGDASHALLLADRAGRQLWRYDFRRHVNVGWAPDGSALAVTDSSGSDFTETFVVSLPTRDDEVLSVAGLFVELVSWVNNHRFLDNHHVYIEAVRWTSATDLLFRARGHGDRDPGGFDRTFRYRIGRGVVSR